MVCCRFLLHHLPRQYTPIPAQNLSLTLHDLVLRLTTVQRLGGFLERSMGSSHLRHQLLAFRPLPHLVHYLEVQDPSTHREADGHGLQDWHRRN
jgi:hypothetical protein